MHDSNPCQITFSPRSSQPQPAKQLRIQTAGNQPRAPRSLRPPAPPRVRFAALLLLTLAAVAQASSPVTFQVDMTAQITGGNFHPESGDRVQVRGGFQGWTGGNWLTNDPSATNPNVYAGTFSLTDLPWTHEEYKFVVILNGADPNSWVNGESLDLPSNNRSFTLTGSPQILPAVYFSNWPPPGTAAAHPISFQVDMSVQRQKGRFHPENGDLVEVRGNFQTNGWWTGGCVLTNDLIATNIYGGTFYDNNAPGAQLGYKYVMLTNGGTVTWESLPNNRVLVEPGVEGLGVGEVFFENDFGTAIPVTFQVDMTAQLSARAFHPELGDLVEVRGSFLPLQWWAGVLRLTNNPAAVDSSVYRGTFYVNHLPGTVEEYKFTINLRGTNVAPESAVWELWGQDNRSFTLASSNQTLPVVLFSGLSQSELLMADTWVTFSVNMSNAVALPWNGNPGFPFNPATDQVFLNGDFLDWWDWSSPPVAYRLTNDGTSPVYSLAVKIPAGRASKLLYGYCINVGFNEFATGLRHVRYARATNAYTLPQDIFGANYEEPRFGNLTIRPALAGHVFVNWLGYPGVRLQTRTNLIGETWQPQPDTDGLSWTNWPVTSDRLFFQLVEP